MTALPEFDPNPPEEAPPMGLGGPQGAPNNRQPGQGQGPGNNRPPTTQGKSISYREDWAPERILHHTSNGRNHDEH